MPVNRPMIVSKMFSWVHQRMRKIQCCVLQAEMRCAVLRCVQLCVTPGTVSHRDPLSMGFPGQEYRVGGLSFSTSLAVS